MIYKHLELRNFGVHQHLEFEPSPRLTGVIGRNGSGKSTVLAAMEQLATGNIPTAGTKDLNVNQLATAGSPSHVAGTIAHAGHTMEVVRGLQKTKSQVVVDGGRPVFGDAKVNAELAEIFGESMNLLSDYVFVKQDDIYSFLEATEANRSKAFAQLFGTAHAEKCWDLAGKQLNRMDVPARSDLLDETRRRRVEAVADLAELRGMKADYAHVKDYDRDADPDSSVVARYRSYKAARDDAKALDVQVAELEAANEAATIAANESACRVAGLREVLEDASTKALDAQVALRTWKAHRRHKKAADALEARKAALAAEKGKRTKPEPPQGYAPTADAQRGRTIADLNTLIDRDEALLASFDGGVAKCPTCGTPASNLAGVLAAAEKALPAYCKHRDELIASHKDAAAYEHDLRRHDEWRAAYKQKKQQLDADVEAFEDEDPLPDVDEDDAATAIDHHAALQSALEDAGNELRRAESRRSQVRGRLDSAIERRAAAKAQRKANRVSREDYEAALEALRGKLRDVKGRGVLLGRIKAAKATLATLDADLARLEAAEASARHARRLAGRLESIRAVLHRGRLPRQVATAYLGLIEGGLNRFLSRCDAGFKVASAAGLSYDCRFEDGRDQPAIRLSRGQMVMLAIGFRVEVNALFASEIGLLCLDEPTRALDRVNIACVEVALARLAELSDATGLQCVLVTHEGKLGRLFDSVVNLQ